MRMKKARAAAAALLCAACLAQTAVPALAAEAYTAPDVTGKTLEQLMDDFRAEHALTGDNFEISFYVPETGEQYDFNETKMLYGASTYKLPLNLYYYDMQLAGEITGDTMITQGASLDEAHYQSLVYSNNELSYSLWRRIGDWPEYKMAMRKYFTMTDDEIPQNYYYDHLFCTRMMLDTLKVVWDGQEQYPELIDYLKIACPDAYFKTYLDVDETPIAHKYGSYEGAENDVGIIWAERPFLLAVYTSGYFIWAAVSTHLCTLLDWSASAYCSIWIVLTTESAYELWRVLIWTAQALGMRHLPLHSTPMLLGQLGFTIACCVTVRYTMARTMPEDGIYHIGPRQLGSAGLLGAIFVFQFFALQTSLRVGLQPSAVVAPSMLTQFYCVTLLYLQTELFKKAAMQKEMDALNLLYDRQRKQYQIARQNVQIINRKCHELKVQIADLRRLQPDEATTRSLDEAEQAARMYDANAATGNEVLDVVLTEKSLLCEAQRIRLNCVADGTCLAAIEPGDLYALFSNLLDQAIDAAAQQQNDRRMIDLLVCRRQGFAVINVIGPALSGSQSDHGRRHSYELKVARRVVQKYSGTMATEPRGELFAVKIVLPLTRG